MAVTTYVALLRGINVGGQRRVAMADLRQLLTRLGFRDGQSLLQSGNLVFRGDRATGAHIERLLEAEAAKRLGLRTDFFVRTGEHCRAIVARNPFGQEAKRDPGRLLVLFLKDPPDAKAMNALRAAITGPERVAAGGSDAYAVYPNGVGRSRLTNAVIEAKLGTRVTGRNWNTMLKLAALATA